jgi:type VI secretion system secreted protein Hcp
MKRFLAPLILGLSLLAAPALAANSMFVKIGDIRGESTDRDHRNWIDVSSFSWGVSNTGGAPGGGGGGGRTLFSDLNWTQNVDASTVPVFIGAASGTVYDVVTFDVVRRGERSVLFFQMIFEDASLGALQISGSSGAGDPFASVSLMSSKLTMNYWPQDAKGGRGDKISGSWDLRTGTGGFNGDINVLTGLFLSGGTVGAIGDLPLSPVPEPQAALLLLLGLAVLGGQAALRARRQRVG